MYPLLLFINIHGAGDEHFAPLINTSQLVTDAVHIGKVPITMFPVEMNISALHLDFKLGQNVVPLHNRGAQIEDNFK